MKIKTLLLFLSLMYFTNNSIANEDAVKVAKVHFNNYFKRDFKNLSKTYAQNVLLMPGHDYLKFQYGLQKKKNGGKHENITCDELVAVMVKFSDNRPVQPIGVIKEYIKNLTYKVIATDDGDVSDLALAPKGSLCFTMLKDDVLVKVSPPNGADFKLVLLREINKKWRKLCLKSSDF